MKKASKNEVKRQIEKKMDSVSEDTLEFLSLDDETIEAYERQMKAASSHKKTAAQKKAAPQKKKEKVRAAKSVKTAKKHKIREVYEEDYETEDFETEELEEIDDRYDEETDEDDDRYYAEDEVDDDRYYAEDEVDGDRYYAEDEADDGRYYADDEDEADDDRYYADDEDEVDDEEEYYADSRGYRYEEDDEGSDRYYADEDEEDEEEYYADSRRYRYEDDDEEEDEEDEAYYEDEYYEDDEDEEDDEEYESGNIFVRFGDFIANMSALDHVVMIFGCFILVAAVATGALYVNARTKSGQVEAFAEIGGEAENIKVIGESGLLAVSNAESLRLSQMVPIEEEGEFAPEVSQNSTIEIAMNLTSIQSDLKIKFVNKQTNKLIGGIPFEVSVTGDNGKSFSLKDEDKDGIIYQTGVTAGSYTVSAVALQGADYEKYTFPDRAETIKVTDTITYKKVDVSDEIKTEAEVNVAAEDTAQQDTVIESVLTDTVEWVESTRQEINADNNYNEIKKADIPDPATLGRAGTFMKTSGLIDPLTDNMGNPPQNPDDTGTSGGTTSGGSTETPGGTTSGGSTETPGGTTSGGSTETPGGTTSGGSTETPGGTTSGGSTETPGGTTSGGSTEIPGGNSGTTTPENPPAPTQYTISVSGGGTIQAGQSCTLSAVTNPVGTVKWSSSNTAVATVDNSGNVTGVSAGTAEITATVVEGSVSAKCTVTVTAAPVKYAITLSGGGTIQIGSTCTVSAATTPAGTAVTWTSSNPKIATVNSSGVVTGVAVGNVEITGTVGTGSESVSAKCSVAVTDIVYKSVTITGSSTIQVGKKETLKATTDPAGGTVTWSSDNEAVLRTDSTGAIKGVSEGKATVTATCGNVKGTWTVTVVKDLSTDTVSKLKDKSGNQVYVKNAEGKYVEATYADYYKDQKLYLRKANAECFYTGWQSINGYTYFYDKNGNVVTGEQIIQGAKYSFGSDGRLSSGSGVLGIDVSKWNGSIDWNAVKNSGISYVIIRCGYRGSSTGALIEDPKFKSNIQGAKAAGLKVGVYFFSQAVNEVEAVEEASMAINLVSGYGLNFPIFLDVESSGGRGDYIDAGTRTAVCKAFCSTVQNSGYAAGVYANKTWFTSYINTGSLTGYKIWLAQYAAAPTYTATRYDMWQYSSKGTVGGISGSVDMNISYMGY